MAAKKRKKANDACAKKVKARYGINKYKSRWH